MTCPGTSPGHVPGGACVVFFVAPVGRLAGVQGLEEARAVAGVLDVHVYRRARHVFGPLRRGADRAGAVLAVGGSRPRRSNGPAGRRGHPLRGQPGGSTCADALTRSPTRNATR